MTPTVSIVVVAFNEEQSIPGCLEKLSISAEAQQIPIEVIGVNNGSSDDTLSKMKRWESLGTLDNTVSRRVIDLPSNRFFSGGLLAGVEAATANWVLSYSADIFFSSEDLARFISVISPNSAKQKVDIIQIGAVVGERPNRPGYAPHVKLFSACYSFMLRNFFRVPLNDFNWVCLYQKQVLQKLDVQSRSVFFHAEVLIRMNRLGYKLPTVHAPVFERVHGKPTVARPRTWLAIIKDVFRFLLSKEDRI